MWEVHAEAAGACALRRCHRDSEGGRLPRFSTPLPTPGHHGSEGRAEAQRAGPLEKTTARGTWPVAQPRSQGESCSARSQSPSDSTCGTPLWAVSSELQNLSFLSGKRWRI